MLPRTSPWDARTMSSQQAPPRTIDFDPRMFVLETRRAGMSAKQAQQTIEESALRSFLAASSATSPAQ